MPSIREKTHVAPNVSKNFIRKNRTLKKVFDQNVKIKPFCSSNDSKRGLKAALL